MRKAYISPGRQTRGAYVIIILNEIYEAPGNLVCCCLCIHDMRL